MKKIDSFTNLYPLSKTLRFSLVPIGKTEEHFNERLLLKEDEERAEAYEIVKGCIDRLHVEFLEVAFENISIDLLADYIELYYKLGKGEQEYADMKKLEEGMRKQLSSILEKHPLHKILFQKEILEYLLERTTDKREVAAIKSFQKFYTYFVGYNENRKNIYKPEISNAVPYRCINDNLPKYLDNARVFYKILQEISGEDFEEFNDNIQALYSINIADVFCPENFSFVLAQKGIDIYNSILGGYSCPDGTKIQGINERINLYNQNLSKENKRDRLPMLKALYKQILVKKDTVSFSPVKFQNDEELLMAIRNIYNESVPNMIKLARELFVELSNDNTSGIFMEQGPAITAISNAVFGSWNAISDAWNCEYDEKVSRKKNKSNEQYAEERRRQYKKEESFSLRELQRLGEKEQPEDTGNTVVKYIMESANRIINKIELASKEAVSFFVSYNINSNEKKLCQDEKAIGIIKNLLDSIKELEKLLKSLQGTGREECRDTWFYGKHHELIEHLPEMNHLYDKVRNYLTQKSYSNNKIKLNFQKSDFLGGWSQGYETKGAMLFREAEKYYIGILNRRYSAEEISRLTENAKDSKFERIVYDFQKPDNKNTPRLFIRSKGDSFAPAVERLGLPIQNIIDIYDKGYFKTEYRKVNEAEYRDSLIKIIEYFKQGFSNHESYKQYEFKWKKSEEYKDIAEFYRDTIESCYALHFEKIDFSMIEELIDEGELYLFQIYNKDFSEYSHGAPNLHTLYFKMLFDEKNLENVVFQLNGGAEMFYRKASIQDADRIIHPANMPIKNKNLCKEKDASVFEYDLIKDKRFTSRKFMLHIPITLNFKARGQEFIKYEVLRSIKNSAENYVIGIDRGERNLLYVCVINSKGEIVEQKSLNEIINNGYKVDYHKLLDKKETERGSARKNWTTIENIKNLKEGYLSQVVHEICRLLIKYDAIIAMEDLNFGFKRGRYKVEKQVYQKFENMLISKLNFLVEKSANPTDNGGLLKAYQLTNKDTGVRKREKQNGFIFYVPAYLTSKIDPTTGFVDLLKPKFSTVSKAIEFVEKIDDIRYNAASNLFEFDVDYDKFQGGSMSYKKKWTLCSYGERIVTFRNPNKNNEWDNRTVVLTEEYMRLFNEYEIEINGDIKSQMLKIAKKEFYHEFFKLLRLMLQLRNSEMGNVDVDYLVSPVRNEEGKFFDSRLVEKNGKDPNNADANGAYNIARKAMWAISRIKDTSDDELNSLNIAIKNAEWLEYVQK